MLNEVQNILKAPAKEMYGDLPPEAVTRDLTFDLFASRRPDMAALELRLEVKHHPTKKVRTTMKVLPERSLGIYKEAMASILHNTVKQMVAELAPHLYPYDPRIGTVFTHTGPSFPACPIFDRPDGKDKTQAMFLRNAAYQAQQGEPPREEYGVSMVCPFCQEDLNPHYRPLVWGSGALCWVHQDCWKQGNGKSPTHFVK